VSSSDQVSTGDSVRFVSRRRRLAIGAVAGSSFIGGSLEAVFLILITQIAFSITQDQTELGDDALVAPSIDHALVAATIVILLRLTVATAASAQAANITARAVGDVRRELSDAYLAADWTTQQSQPAGSLQQLLNGYSGNAAGLVQQLTQCFVSGANLVAMLVLAVFVDPVAALAVIAIGGCLAAILRPVRLAVRRRAHDEATLAMSYASSTAEISQIGLEVTVFGVEAQTRSRLRRHIDQLEQAARRVGLARNLLTPVYSSMAYLAIVATLLVASRSNSSDISSVGAGILVMLRSLGYAQGLQSSVTGVISNAPAVGELQLVLADLERGRRRSPDRHVEQVWPISFDRVSYAYGSDERVLAGIDLEFGPNEIIGLIGPSGSGKSTLVELLLGLRTPTAGHIRVGGTPLAELSTTSWNEVVSLVPQRPHIIRGTIGDNIRFFRYDVTDRDIHNAARQAYILDDVLAFPDGFERELGTSGVRLSGGQEQRITIARALIGTPQLLILDEPTSALDPASEQAVREALSSLRSTMSILVIAHRSSTLSICDRLLRLDRGRVEEIAPGSLDLDATDLYAP